MNTPVLRRLKKSSSTVGNAPTFRIVVFGQSGVGKTAMSVRFVTKRFIGEYDPTLENIYQHSCVVGGSTVLFEIMDTAGQEENNQMMEEKMRWADAFILVYAINDQLSFDEMPRLKFLIAHMMSHHHKQAQPEPVVAIVGNKNDLEPDRMVSHGDGENLAKNLHSLFFEISVRDGFSDVTRVFEEIFLEYRRRSASFTTTYDVTGLIKRKEKSFKYVDRIPRMQGNKRSYIINDVINSDVMMTRIEEEEYLDSQSLRKTSVRSRTSDIISSDVTEQTVRRPEPRARRNAVVAFGSMNTGAIPDVNTQNGDVSDDVTPVTKPRRAVLERSSCINENSFEEHEHKRVLRRHHTVGNYDANNNNHGVIKEALRCRSVSDDVEENLVIENLSKRSLSLEVPRPRRKRVS